MSIPELPPEWSVQVDSVNSNSPGTSATIRTWLLAALGCGLFYGGGYLSGSQFFLRYFCGHPLEYISAGMFFVGLTILVQKGWRLGIERRALADAGKSLENELTAETLAAWVDSTAPQHQSTQAYRRLQETVQYLKGNLKKGLEEHLRYLAELASDRLHQSYATIRTITWAIPILGFLGTVIGITMAIAKVTPEQLDSSLASVTSGLSVAFDTTALALGMSIVLVFAAFLAERSEQRILSDVEQFGIDNLLPAFSRQENADDQQPQKTPPVLDPDLWSDQMEQIREVWAEMLKQHADDFREGLDRELQETLQLHREGVADSRDAYRQTLEVSTERLLERTGQILETFEDRVRTWQEAVLASSQASVQQSEALHDVGATLLRLTESGNQLSDLQQQLNDNLQALQVAETMERTAGSLTAAVHVLTAKTSARNVA